MELVELEQARLIRSVAKRLVPDETTFKQLRTRLHPDKFQPDADMVARATAVYPKLQQLWDMSQAVPTIVSGAAIKLELHDKIGEGDVSEVFTAISTEPQTIGKLKTQSFLVKLPRVHGAEPYLDTERKRLTTLAKAAQNTTYAHYFPEVFTTVKHDGYKGSPGTVFVYPVNGEHFTLASIRDKHPNGLDGWHICWMFRRLLTALGFVHRQGLVHGAVLPQHILIEPLSHGLQLCGWIHSVEKGGLIKIVPQSHKDMYPNEVTSKKYAGPETDIYMAANVMLRVSDSRMPHKLKQFLKSLLLTSPGMRPNDAFKLEEEFVVLMDSVYGKRQFVSLEV
jgi:serine/threonine protein kinase